MKTLLSNRQELPARQMSLFDLLDRILDKGVVINGDITVAFAGAWYFVSGFAVVVLASQTHTLSPWTMGLPFVIGQSVMAGILYVASGDHDVED